MGALDTLNGTGAALALDNNGDIPETAIPATVARDTEINDGTLTFTGASTGTFTANQAGATTINIPAGFSGNYNDLSNRPTIPAAAANATITLAAGTGLTGGGNFTTNQSSNETITFNASSSGFSPGGVGSAVWVRFQPRTNNFIQGQYQFSPASNANGDQLFYSWFQGNTLDQPSTGSRITGGTWRLITPGLGRNVNFGSIWCLAERIS